jgi:putative DNA primase/helicase
MANEPGRRPWSKQVLVKVIASALGSGSLQPRRLVEAKLIRIPSGESHGPVEPRPQPIDRPLTDLGNDERLLGQADGTVRYDYAFNTWLCFNGKYFKRDEDGEINRLAKITVRGIALEAAEFSRQAMELRTRASAAEATDAEKKDLFARAEKAEKKARAISNHALNSERATAIGNMIKLASVEQGTPISQDDLDVDPWLLNLDNCVYDLKSGRALPHSREHLITKTCGSKHYPVWFDPKATCERWLKFLAEVFPGEYAAIIPFLRRAIGYSLTGLTREECLFLMTGDGRNGKGSILNTLMALLGDYGGTAAFSTFLAQKDDSRPREDIASMVGKRFISAQETKKEASLVC